MARNIAFKNIFYCIFDHDCFQNKKDHHGCLRCKIFFPGYYDYFVLELLSYPKWEMSRLGNFVCDNATVSRTRWHHPVETTFHLGPFHHWQSWRYHHPFQKIWSNENMVTRLSLFQDTLEVHAWHMGFFFHKFDNCLLTTSFRASATHH